MALTPELARAAMKDGAKLGRMLGVHVLEARPGPDFATTLPRTTQGVEQTSPEAEPTCLIVPTADRTLIGETGFHGPPGQSRSGRGRLQHRPGLLRAKVRL